MENLLRNLLEKILLDDIENGEHFQIGQILFLALTPTLMIFLFMMLFGPRKCITDACVQMILFSILLIVLVGLGMLLAKRGTLIQQICVRKSEKGILKRNDVRRNVKVGKDLLAPFGILFSIFSKLITDIFSPIMRTLDKNISLGSPFSDLPLDDFGIWFSLFLVCSCFIIPNYCYYSELDYIIDQDTGKRTGDGKEEDLNERTYKVTILEKK